MNAKLLKCLLQLMTGGTEIEGVAGTETEIGEGMVNLAGEEVVIETMIVSEDLVEALRVSSN